MENWIASYMLAQVMLEERLRERKREPVVLFNVNFNWLRPIVKSLVGLFL
ncbi:MAG TPA: hypothetical protein PKZ84_19610 [Anaerolineae bacterium]|nr:hypothetical protein [Anaerolineae bacterium]HQI86860.1 hypothetical protein [Anaerolineae bacterium]